MVLKSCFYKETQIFWLSARNFWTFWPANVEKSWQNCSAHLYIIAFRLGGEIYDIRILRVIRENPSLGKSRRPTKNWRESMRLPLC
jgi:hypothetical protein